MIATYRPHRHALACLALVLLPAGASTQQATPSPIAGIEVFASAFDAVPCKDKDRLPAVKALFEQAGAPASVISIDAHDDVENLVVVKPGASAEKIVIGAHYDKVADGCGAVDNWTGQVAMTQLYRTLREIPTSKTLVFVAFGREEKGLVGSRAMVKAISDEQVAQHCAMVNIDSLGLAAPQVADNMSSKPMGLLAEELAQAMEMPFGHGSIARANSDSSAFVERGIPALTIHGLDNSWTKVLHTHRDKAARINPTSVYLGYRLALAMVARLDQSACAAYGPAKGQAGEH